MTGRFGLELVIGVLACVGLWVTVDKTAAGLLRAWGWVRRDRVAPLLEDACPDCGGTDGHEWDCPVDPALDPLPPERTREELGFTDPTDPPAWISRQGDVAKWLADPTWRPPEFLEARERRAPWWEAEHRAAYESLGFDYPSGLMARVRELTP